MNSQSISYLTPLVRYSMKWNEIEVMEVELDEPEPYFHATSNKLALVFVGKGKRLSILVPTYWRGGDRAAMLVLLGSQLEERGIEVRRTKRAMYLLSKNAKVR